MKRINIINGIISAENLVEDLIIFGQFDCDANGENGDDFTDREAIKCGFKNTLEYWADLAIKEYHSKVNDTKEEKLLKAITAFADELEDSWSSYGDSTEYSITTDISQDGFLLTFVYIN